MQKPNAIAMPKLGMTMREGTVVEWRAAAGERVDKGAVLLVIESEKSEVDVEAPATGFLRHVYVESGETVPCGTLLAALTESHDEPFDADAFRAEHDRAAAPAAAATASAAAPASAARSAESTTAASRAVEEPATVVATPAARRLAREHGIDLARMAGSGPGGRITREDVEVLAARLAARVQVEPGVALDVVVEGEGDPVLLLPGFGTDASAYAQVIPLLTAHHQVVALNPRGIAFSDAPESDSYTVEVAAADAAAVIAARCTDGATTGSASARSHVVGASLGAAVAIELAATRPELVRSLTLITPPARVTGRLIAVLEAWCIAAAGADREGLGHTIVPWMFSEELLADERRRQRAFRAFARMAAGVDPSALTRWFRGVKAWPGLDATALVRLSVPVLVIVGDGDVLLPSAADVQPMIPGAVLRVIANAGHAVTIEQPEPVVAALREHFARA